MVGHLGMYMWSIQLAKVQFFSDFERGMLLVPDMLL